MITVIISFKTGKSILIAQVVTLGQFVDGRFKIVMDLIFRDTTDRLIALIHRQVDEVIEVREHADLSKLCHTREKRKLDILITCLQHRIESF